jgi:glycosyltransferase involved in cell wall biosynthesis
MKLSIILATLNRADLLPKCLESYEKLKMEKELIVVDGGSTDGSLAILNSYSAKIISEPDQSVYEAWNKGLKEVNGDWVLFLNSDDQLIGDNIERIFKKIPQDFKELISYNVVIKYEFGKTTKTVSRSPRYGFREIISEPIYFNAYAIHRDIFEELGDFDLRFPLCADQSFLWKCVSSRHKVMHFDVPAYVYLSHPKSLTLNRRRGNFFREEQQIAYSFFTSAQSAFDRKFAQKWLDWETVSLQHHITAFRILNRLFNLKTNSQEIYSISRKIAIFLSPVGRAFYKNRSKRL